MNQAAHAFRTDSFLPEPDPGTWSSGAFGIDLRADFDAPGLAGTGVPAYDAPVVHAGVVPCRVAATIWPEEASERLVHWRLEGAGTVLTIDRHPVMGYRLSARDQGTHLISADGSRVMCAPGAAQDWVWQRYLVGQVLPLAAVLRGLEVLHASAVEVDGKAVAFVARSGSGKTSVALNLVLRGATFLADDVAALSLLGGRPWIHSGAPLTNLQRDEDTNIGLRRRLLGEVIGADADTLRIAVASHRTRMAPLRAIYFLHRPCDVATPGFDELKHPTWDTLLASTFTPFHATPKRLRNQFKTLGAVAEQVRLFNLSIPATMGASELSAHVQAHVVDDLA